MTHRGRIVGFVIVALVVLGFVFNIVSNRTRGGQASADPSASPSARDDRQPVAPLYVPQPASVLYGSKLTAQSPADDVAVAFALTFFTFDTGTDDEGKFAKALPRVEASARKDIRGRVAKEWKAVGQPAASSVQEPNSVQGNVSSSDQDGTVVSVTLNQQTRKRGGTAVTNERVVEVTLQRNQGAAGWSVSAFTPMH